MVSSYRPTNAIGPRSGAQCQTCTHANRSAIDDELRRGVLSRREIAAQFGLARHTVDRHVKHGHVTPGPTDGAVGANRRTNIVVDYSDSSPLGILKQTLHTLQSADPQKMSPAQLLGHSDIIRRTVESIAKMEPAKRTSVTIRDVQGLDVFIGILFKNLEDHPDVRDAILADIRAAAAEGKFGDDPLPVPDAEAVA